MCGFFTRSLTGVSGSRRVTGCAAVMVSNLGKGLVPLVILLLSLVCWDESQAQTISPRNSALFDASYEVRASVPTAVSAMKKDRISPTVFGAIIFGVAAAAVVYEADAGPSDSKVPIVIGATMVGGIIGYLLGGLLGPSE